MSEIDVVSQIIAMLTVSQEKIETIAVTQAKMSTLLNTTLPNLPTKAEVQVLINEQIKECASDRDANNRFLKPPVIHVPKKEDIGNKLAGKLTAAVVALGGAIYGLI